MAHPVGVSFKAKATYFDRALVQNAIGKANARNLSRGGAIVRTAARDILRKKGKKTKKGTIYARNGLISEGPAANPGEPPRRHTGKLRDGVRFAYEFGRGSVVIGPVRYNIDGGRVPSLLEFGGTITRKFKQYPGGYMFRARNNRLRPGQRLLTRKQRYHAFPYMGPAMTKAAPKVPQLWANTLRAA